jgi:hypothetical protein
VFVTSFRGEGGWLPLDWGRGTWSPFIVAGWPFGIDEGGMASPRDGIDAFESIDRDLASRGLVSDSVSVMVEDLEIVRKKERRSAPLWAKVDLSPLT